MRRYLLITVAAVLMGCGSEDPTKPPFGSELSVAEQVALNAAFGRLADSLDKRNTANDSIIANFTRVAAQLVRFEGRYGTLNVVLPGSASPVEMRAVAVKGSDGGNAGNTLIAWSALDVATFNAERLLVFQSGGFSSTLAAQMRYLDQTSTATNNGLYSGGGVLTFSAPAFTNNCTGVDNSDAGTCKAGKMTVTGQADISKTGGASSTASFPATTISAFDVVVN